MFYILSTQHIPSTETCYSSIPRRHSKEIIEEAENIFYILSTQHIPSTKTCWSSILRRHSKETRKETENIFYILSTQHIPSTETCWSSISRRHRKDVIEEEDALKFPYSTRRILSYASASFFWRFLRMSFPGKRQYRKKTPWNFHAQQAESCRACLQFFCVLHFLKRCNIGRRSLEIPVLERQDFSVRVSDFCVIHFRVIRTTQLCWVVGCVFHFRVI